jgi:poly-gamma-glutamate synthesis protein (capsule biosynthesis protein)
MTKSSPRWFHPEDLSPRFTLDRPTGRIAPPDRPAPARPATGPAPEAAAARRQDSIQLFASGDIIWERDIQAFLIQQPPEHPFGRIRDLWAGGDVIFAQFETCFGEQRDEELPGKRISYLTDPRLADHLAAGGFNLAAQASNHTMDYGIAPAQLTRRLLAERGIAASGTGRNLAEARQPAVIEVKGRRVALLSYATDDKETNAGPDRPGNAPFVRELVIEDLRQVRQSADFVLVSVHKGREFVGFPSPEHQADCRAIIDAGADLILGHHPHFMQGIEWRRGSSGRQGLIFYSLGSLLVDYEPPLSRYELSLFHRSQRNGFIVRVQLDERGVAELELTPVRQTDDWAVRRETPAEAEHTWDLVQWTSHPVNHEAPCRKFWVTSWPYLAIQYPGMWLAIRKNPRAISAVFRWFFREETLRLEWGALFAREMPDWLLAVLRAPVTLLRAPLRLAKLLKRKA